MVFTVESEGPKIRPIRPPSRAPVHLLLADDSVLDGFPSQCDVVLGSRSVRIDLHEADSLDRELLLLTMKGE